MRRYIPNIITAVRGLFIIPILIFSILGNMYIAGIIFLIAALTDFLDGFLARKWNVVSDFGRKLDPIIDKYLSATILIIISIKYPINLAILSIEVLITILNWYEYGKNKEIRPLLIGKIKTVFLFTYISLLLFNCYFLPYTLFIIIFEISVLISYILKYIKKTH